MITKLKSKEFFLSSTLALGVVAGIGIAAAPAQAAILGEFEWDDATTNFFEDVNPENPDDTFSVTFSPGGFAETFNTSGIFTPPLPDANPLDPPITLNLDPAEGEFELVSFTSDTQFVYRLTSPLVFDFDDDVSVTFGTDELFLGSFELDGDGNRIGVGFVEQTVSAVVNIDGDIFPTGNLIVREEITFGDLPGGEAGEFGAIAQVVEVNGVPEPATILGLLAVGGLGLGLKRKK